MYIRQGGQEIFEKIVKGAGLVKQAGGKYDERAFSVRWYLLFSSGF